MGGQWHTFDKAELTIREAFEKLEGYVDASDPDITLPNVLHAFQTAEAARAANKPDWFVFTAFIHDMGKIMYNWGRAEDGQEVWGRSVAGVYVRHLTIMCCVCRALSRGLSGLWAVIRGLWVFPSPTMSCCPSSTS